ncbi:MAG TPA: A24 family peptidase [Solirubrobacteraceae bacterium]|nr:A24 family peptidase [Solirubrobacteraceae bacterium]
MARQISLNLTRDGGTGRNEPLRVAATVLLIALWVLELALHRTLTQHVLGIVLIAVLVRITVTDLEERRIKNRVTVPAALLAVLIGLALHPAGVPAQLVAAVATGAFLFVFALLSRGGLGMGDVKLGFVLGLFLGPWVIVAMVVGLVASAVLSLGVLVARGLSAGRRTAIPLGPFLALGGVVALIAGPHWHLAT